MITAYLTCLIFGGVLTLASLVSGSSDGHADAGGESSPDSPDAHGHASGGHFAPGLLPFLSLRFWIFFVTFFGFSGTGLSLLGAGGVALIAVIASAVGLTAGYTGSRVLQSLAARPVGLLGDASGHVGREAQLLLPLSRTQRSKVRLNIGGISTDLVAETESDEPLAAGAPVLVVGIRGTTLLVEPVPGARDLSPRSAVPELPSKPPKT